MYIISMVRTIQVPFEDKEAELLEDDKREKESWHDYLLRKVVGEDWGEKLGRV